MKVGDFVKGKTGSTYSITNENMTRGVIVKVENGYITVKVLDHTSGECGKYEVDPQYFEVIGHVKPFDRDEVLELLKKGCKKAILDYDLSGADLRGANLSGANLSGANLSGADLRRADLSDANLDFTCMPLRCGGLKWHIDKRIACQLAYHLCSMQCDDAEYIKLRNQLLPFANQFHRVEECGRLVPVEEAKNDDKTAS